MIYKVGTSGRNKSHERRIEITSTYFGGRLAAEPNATDVVLGYAPDEDVFVGFDSRRLEHGGRTENASAFIDVEGLRLASDTEIAVLPRESGLFGLEYHAFFKPTRMSEYLVNHELIHAGAYAGAGPFAGTTRPRRRSAVRVPASHAVGGTLVLNEPLSRPRRRPASAVDVAAVESGNSGALRGRRMSPKRFQELLRRADENGALGEMIALEAERRRLSLAGKPELAAAVRWTSRENVLAGYDIRSFEIDGSDRFIEVKATAGSARRFVVSPNEWRTALRLRSRYWIYLVTAVRSQPELHRLQDPVGLEEGGRLRREPHGWAVTIR